MDDDTNMTGPAPVSPTRSISAFQFHGNWQDFAKIAFPNLLLTIVTLGFYRFWATKRERDYLWSQTEFIDERLEWTGTGMELFIGFLIVTLFIGVPFFIVSFAAQAAIFRGHEETLVAVQLVLFLIIFYLTGVAYFRALRYRLSRTYWRGIRGGSNEPGFRYGLAYLLKYFLPIVPGFAILSSASVFGAGTTTAGIAAGGGLILMLIGGLFYPWASISLWNERWSHMSFGPHNFESRAQWKELMRRYLAFYLVPFLLVVGLIAFSAYTAATGENLANVETSGIAALGIFSFFIVLAFYIFLPIAALMYYSKYFRVAVGGLKLQKLEFEFTARSADWILFTLANMAIVVCTLGIGYIFMPYRNWSFFVRHIEAYGEINLDELTQSDTVRTGHGEGLLDAFDVGAI